MAIKKKVKDIDIVYLYLTKVFDNPTTYFLDHNKIDVITLLNWYILKSVIDQTVLGVFLVPFYQKIQSHY